MRAIDAGDRATNILTRFVFAGLFGAAAANTGPKRFACTGCHVRSDAPISGSILPGRALQGYRGSAAELDVGEPSERQ